MHRKFFNDVSNQLDNETKACRCGCAHAPTLDAVVTVAVVNGEVQVYATEGTEPGDVLAAAIDCIDPTPRAHLTEIPKANLNL